MKNNLIALSVCFLIGVCCSTIYNRIAITTVAPKKQYRILAFISSYKRPMLLSGQISRLKDQTYKNFDLSVSLKGVETTYLAQTFLQEWYPLIDSGWMHFQIDQNRDQLANQLDPMRGIHLDKYDYFCKIDDDDWYSPDYFEDINNWLNRIPDTAMSYSEHEYELYNHDDKAVMTKRIQGIFGNTMCFSRDLIKVFFDIEADRNAHPQIIDSQTVSDLKARNEDHLFDEISYKFGIRAHRISTNPKLIYGQQYPGVFRQNSKIITVKTPNS